jgi:microcystin degradation protein MlrC
MRMRIAIGGAYHETHSLATPQTPLEAFSLYRGPQLLETYGGTRTELGGAISAADGDVALVPLLFAYTLPSGPIERGAYEAIASELVRGVEREQPDALFLVLHGAMLVEGMSDAEGELLERLRAVLGERPLAVTVDFHANLSERVVGQTDLLVGYKTYPHVDPYDRARECFQLLLRQLKGEIRPVSAIRKLPLITPPPTQETSREPMRSLIARAVAMEGLPGVLTASVTGAFAYADEPRTGMACVVITDGDRALAERLAGELADQAWAARAEFRVESFSPAAAVRQALAFPGPVALVDVADNVGGGTAADGTVILAELMAAGATGALVTLRDAEAVAQAFAAGEGGLLETRVGAKTDRYHGEPVPVSARVLRLQPDGRWRFVGAYMTGQPGNAGRMALVRVDGVDIVLTEQRITPMDRGYLDRLKIDPCAYRIFVVKGALAWKTGFGDLVERDLFVDAPGITPIALSALPYRRLTRPIYPLDPM